MAILLGLGQDTGSTRGYTENGSVYRTFDGYTATGNGTATSINALFDDWDNPSKVRLAVFDSSENLLTETAELDWAADTPVSGTINLEITNGTTYIIGAMTNGIATPFSVTHATKQTHRDISTYGAFADPIPDNNINITTSSEYVLWLEGTESGGGISIPVAMHHYNQMRN